MEVEIIEILRNITNQSACPYIKKVIAMDFDLKMNIEQFTKFRKWIAHNGFIETVPITDDMVSRLFLELDYGVEGSPKRHMLRYRHYKDKKTVFITYIEDCIVTVEKVIYFEGV